MDKPNGHRNTFVIQVMDTQNATWQGTITWANNSETKPFRSVLELIKLLDSAIEAETPKA